MNPVLLACLVILLVSCSRKQSSVGDERLKWNVATLVDAYEQSGRHDSKWDGNAKQALTEFARARGGDPAGESRLKLAGDLAKEAAHAGCDDPLIQYLACELGEDPSKSLPERRDEFRRMANGMDASAYSPLRKFYANVTTANFLYRGRETNLWPEVRDMRSRAVERLSEALMDKRLPVEEASEACLVLLQTLSRNEYELTNAWPKIEAPLFKNWPHAAFAYFVKGQFYYEFAWRGRGTGAASRVTDTGWKLFGERLAVAEEAYLKAWALNPKDVRIPTQMIEMCVSQQKNSSEMEVWFQRAMALDTNNYEACLKKLRFLSPQWYGSRDAMVEFGRECVASVKWGGRVPLILVDAHLRAGSARASPYWTQPDVWPDLKSSYEKFFQLNPNATGYRSYYARYALWCGQWQEFITQVSSLRDSAEGLDYSLFGSEADLTKALEFAKQQAVKN